MKNYNFYIQKSLITFLTLCALCVMGFTDSDYSSSYLPPVSGGGEISVSVSTGNDDAEENLTNGSVGLTSTDLELVTDGAVQLVGMRFQSINIPQGAKIVSAYIEFECDEVGSTSATTLTISGEAIDDAPTFTTSTNNISSRTKTSASTPWNISGTWVVNSKYKTSNFAPVVEEIVGRSGWSPNNDVVIMIGGSGQRIVESYNGEPSAAAKLVVVYDNTPQTANLLKYSVQTENTAEFFSYDPDPTCGSEDWGTDWTKFTCPDGFEFEEYDDGSIIAYGTLIDNANASNRWDAYFRYENKRTWAEWDALGRMFYQSGSGTCNANHMDWHYYEIDSLTSRFIGTVGYANEGKYSKIRHNPTDYVKGTQVGFGANNNNSGVTHTCQTYDIRGWCNLSGDLNLQCVDFGFNIAGYEENNACLIPNGSFEDDLDYWYTEAPAGDVFITNDAYSGSKAVELTGDYDVLSYNWANVVPGDAYLLSAFAKKIGAPGWSSLQIRFYDKDRNHLYLENMEILTTDWQQYVGGGIAPAGAYFIGIQLYKGAGGSIIFDDVCLEIFPEYTPSNCESITNAGFESPISTEWSPYGSVTQTTDAYEGTYAALIGGATDAGISTAISVNPGEIYNLEVYIKETGSPGWSSMGMSFYDSSWNLINGTLTDIFTSSYTQQTLMARAPSNAAFLSYWISKSGGGEVYVDAFCIKGIQVTEICNDGIDNDSDLLVDCDDPDCITGGGCTAECMGNNLGFESGLTNWSTTGSPVISNDAAVGSNSVYLDDNADRVRQTLTVEADSLYQLTFWAKGTVGGNDWVGAVCRFYDSGGTYIGQQDSKTWGYSNWQHFFKFVQAPPGAATMELEFAVYKSDASTEQYFDDFCFQKSSYDIPLPSCSGCEIYPPAEGETTFWFKNNSGWIVHDVMKGSNLCDNGDGTKTLRATVLNGKFETAYPCGDLDGWDVEFVLTDKQDWATFNGNYDDHGIINNPCTDYHTDWDFWEVSGGTLSGIGCNAGQVHNITGNVSGYRIQVGTGANSNSCNFGLAGWVEYDLNGTTQSFDVYFDIDENCYLQLAPCPNFVTNEEFDSGTTDWSLYNQSGNTAGQSIDNTNQLSGVNSNYVNISATSGTYWHTQLIQGGKSLESGKTYIVSFEAKASASRNIHVALQQNVSPWAGYWGQTVALTTTAQTFSYDYTSTINNSGDVGVYFNLGETSDNVWIDNVTFSEQCNLFEICGNGSDDDGDGSTDSDDPDCFSCSSGLLTNPEFTNDLTNWTDLGFTTIQTESNGNKYARISGGEGGFSQNFAGTPGTTYILDFVGKNTGSESSIGGLSFFDASWTKLIPDQVRGVSSSDFKQYSVSFTAPANTAWVTPFGWKSAGSGTADFDGFCMRVGTPEICANNMDDDGDGLTDSEDPECGTNCLLSNPYPGLAIDFLNDQTGWIVYNLGSDLILINNDDGTMTISGAIEGGAPVDFGSGMNGTSCGSDDGWTLNLALSDRMNWTAWQAAGGSAYLNSNCPGEEANWDYWNASGTLTGTGCNTGRTLTIVAPSSPYRLQIGTGANSNDNTCAFGLSTWFNINEGGTPIDADIYAFLDVNCYDPSSCQITNGGEINQPYYDCPAADASVITSKSGAYAQYADACNLISNNEFDAGTSNYALYQNSGVASWAVDNGSELSGTNSASIDITSTSYGIGNIEFAQVGLDVDKTKTYSIQFTAKAEAATHIAVSVQLRNPPYTNYYWRDLNLTTTADTFTFDNIQIDTTLVGEVGLMFKFGTSWNNVWIDDIYFGEQYCSPSGALEYQWQQRTSDGSGGWNAWTDISGATSETYDPPAVTVATQYQRNGRIIGEICWVASNLVEVSPCGSQFVCDGTFYQTIELNDDYWLYKIETDPVQIMPVVNLTHAGVIDRINNAVYDKSDGYIYFANMEAPFRFYRVDADGKVQHLGNISGFWDGSGINAAEITTSGDIIFRNYEDSDFYQLDKTTMSVTEICDFPTLNGSQKNIGDFAYNPIDGKYYGTRDDSNILWSVDLATCDSAAVNMDATIDGAHGAFFISADGYGYGYANNSGNFHRINLTNGQVDTVGQGATTSQTDGCSCDGIKFTKEVTPDTTKFNQAVTYTFSVYNNWTSALTNVDFRDTLTDGLTWVSEPKNGTNGITFGASSINGSANGVFTITNLPQGVSTFEIDAFVPANYAGAKPYMNQGYLESLPALLGNTKPSDFPLTPELDDPTPLYFYPEICNNIADDDGDGLADCADPDCGDLNITNVSVGNCINQPLLDVAIADITLTWTNAIPNDSIQVTLNGKKEYIDVPGGTTSPHVISLMVEADGSTNIPVTASWKNTPEGCSDATTFDAPATCSNDQIYCNILYLCGNNKYQDAEPWDHGIVEYLDLVNGNKTLTPAVTKSDLTGVGLYNAMNTSVQLSITFSDYDLIVISPSVGNQYASDLIDSLKIFPGGILNMERRIADDLGIASADGYFNSGTEVYTDDTNFFTVYNYDNPNAVWGSGRTVYNYNAGANVSLWRNAGKATAGTDGVMFFFSENDALPGILSHGDRVQLGYHMDGFYYNSENGGVTPTPSSAWFDPIKHLTLEGKYYLDSAIVLAATSCSLLPEICDDGDDNDQDGFIDCADIECNGTLAVSSSTPLIGCGGGGSQIDLVTTGTLPYSYVWSDMAPTAHWTFDKTTNDISGNGHDQNGGQTGTLNYSNSTVQGKYAAEFSGDDYIRYSIDGGFMEVSFTQMSISTWIKPTNLSGIQTLFDEGSASNGIELRLNNNILEAAVRNASIQANSNALTFPNDGNWHHVAMSFDNGAFVIYLDGIASTLVTTPFTTVGNHSGNGGIGYLDSDSGFGTGSGNYYVGLMDDFRYFVGNSLNANQVTDLARNDGDRFHLADGTYAVTVTNGSFCQKTENESIDIENYVNIDNGGIVAQDQSICSGSTPAAFTSTSLASGGSGNAILYQWDTSLDGIVWTKIGGATAITYQAPSLTVSTYYRRGAYRGGCSNKIYSNVLLVTVVDNFTDPGSIIGDEENCSSYDPMEISSLAPASGGQGGTTFYQWQSSTDNVVWMDISGGIAETFDPPTVTQTTYFRRKARRNPCSAWVHTNAVVKTVVTPFNNAGAIQSSESVCGPYDPNPIGSVSDPSGGAGGSIQIRWQQRVLGGSWSTISGEYNYSYDPPAITESMEYRRIARRFPCTAWVISNTILKEVLAEPVATISTAPTGAICGNVGYAFQALDAGSSSAIYNWNFGPYATPSIAGGNGPHLVSFDFPTDAPLTAFDVTLDVVLNGCITQDVLSLNGKPELTVTNITARHPSTCSSNNGGIDIFAVYPTGSDIQVSIDAGLTWEPANEFSINNLGSGNYIIYLRYATGGCSYMVGTIELFEPFVPPSGINEDYQIECDGFSKTFSAIQDPDIDSYTWDFGDGASPATATGAGPHNVTYSTYGQKFVSLETKDNNCLVPYSENFEIIASLVNGGVIASDQFLCADPNPDVLNNVISASGGGGSAIIYQWQKRTKLNPNVWGAWQNIAGANSLTYDPEPLTEVTQFRRIAWREGCPDIVVSNIVVVTPSTSPIANGESFTSVCPGQTFGENVSLNDLNVQNAKYRIAVPPNNGRAIIFSDGSFFYEPNSTFCGTDQFTYEVCSDNGTCCDQAVVSLNLADNEAPKLENIPEDITIHCDEEVPLPPFVVALENCLSVSLGMDQISTQGIDTCSLYDYELTRIWTATDYCGNSASEQQVITVEDITAPDIYRVYTLPNGKKMVAGIMENVGGPWKNISLPITFGTKPIILTQITTEVDDSTAVVQLRNISTSQFEMRLREEEGLDGEHGRESVAWIAIEEGAMTSGEIFEAGQFSINDAGTSIGFTQNYGGAPIYFGDLQSTFEQDPVVVDAGALNGNGVTTTLVEEQSADGETSHLNENLGYVVLKDAGNLQLLSGEVFGEAGNVTVNSTWQTINLTNVYHNPVVIANVNSSNDTGESLVRVKGITTTSFQIKLEEWEYQNGSHGNESVSYMVVEGSIPLDKSYSCDAIPDALLQGTEIIAVDNCDLTVGMEYAEVLNPENCAPDNELIRTWTSTDECGNSTSYTRTLSIFDNTDPDFTVPADVTVSCLDDINDLVLTGDVTDETDNCATGLDATYNDIFLTPFTCDSSFTVYREWTLDDGCGNSVTKTQLVNIIHQGVALRLKMFIQGALYASPDTLMRDNLRALGILPLTEPYSGLPHFLHIGQGGGETVNPSVFNVTGVNAIVDWVFIEIRNSIQADSIIATRSALMQRDGDIVDVDGFSPVKFNAVQPGSYNVAIRHRNHLGVMTKYSKVLTEDPGNSKVDFTKPNEHSSIFNESYGWEDLDQDGKVLLCHNGNTIEVSTSSAIVDKDHGDICGPCGDYVTVADGDWDDPNVWLNGNVPPHRMIDIEVRITHDVATETEVEVETTAILWVENGSLIIDDANFKADGGVVYFLNSDLSCKGFKNHVHGSNERVFVMKGGSLIINEKYDGHEGAYAFFENVCIYVEGEYITKGIENFINTRVILNNGNFKIEGTPANLNMVDGKFHVVNGNFENAGTLTGNLSGIWIQNGNIVNNGNWQVGVDTFCLSGNPDGVPLGSLPSTQSCSLIAGVIGSQSCNIIDPSTMESDPLEALVHGDHSLAKINGVYATWAADLNGDRNAIYQGPGTDILTLFIQVITDTSNVNHLPNYIRNSYDCADLDLDGDVIYQGPDNDRSKLLFDVILHHPGNTQLLPNFIINEQLPR